MQTARIEILHVPWDEWYASFPWEQGQHVAVIAETGGGKSTLVRHLINKRDYSVVLGTKPKDKTYDRYLATGVKRITQWPPPKPFFPWDTPTIPEQYLLWPKMRKIEDVRKIGPLFKKALENIFFDGSWTVVLDDLYYLAMRLKLADIIAEINFQVRALGISQVACMQRPRWVPRATWGQSSHAFLQALSDPDDLSEMRGLYRMSTQELMYVTSKLAKYEWLYRNKADPFSLPVIIKPPDILQEVS